MNPNKYPRISVITACYNSEKYLEEAINSLLNQTYKNFEYIIVDGGSTDQTLPIIRKYASHIHALISEPDQGVYDAFNKGIRSATGDIIYFLNSDDYFKDNKVLEDVAREFYSDSKIKLLYGNVDMIDGILEVMQPLLNKELNIEDFKKGKMPCHQGVFTSKSLFNELGHFNLSYIVASDFEFLVKCFINYQHACKYIPRTISVFRSGGVSSNIYQGAKEKDKILNEYFGIIPNKEQRYFEINLHYYRSWINKLLLKKQTLGQSLARKGISKVAIFGTKYNALYLQNDFLITNTETVVFIDNDQNKQGSILNGRPIVALDWLLMHSKEIDAIILSFEGDFDEEVRKQIKELQVEKQPLIYSWRELC